MTYKLLIDECLSPALVAQAVEAGYAESTCVRDRGWNGLKDWDLMGQVIHHDYTLVTNNARDFRGEGRDAPGGLFAREGIHAGLVCLISAQTLARLKQAELFTVILDELRARGDLVNQCLEVVEDENGEISVDVYDIFEGQQGADQ